MPDNQKNKQRKGRRKGKASGADEEQQNVGQHKHKKTSHNHGESIPVEQTKVEEKVKEKKAEVPMKQQSVKEQSECKEKDPLSDSRMCTDAKDEETEDGLEAANFAEIVAFGSAGTHFRFKSERLWDSMKDNVHLDNFFTLDMEQLGKSLKCISLEERLRIAKDNFPHKCLEMMAKEAQEAEQHFLTQRLKSSYRPAELPSVRHPSQNTAQDTEKVLQQPSDNVPKEQPAKPPLDTVSSQKMTPSIQVASKVATVTVAPTQQAHALSSLEDWLDSVLDD